MLISQLGGEAAIIKLISEKYSAPTGGGLIATVGDDAALIRHGDKLLIVTTDILIENTHFRLDMIDPYLLGWKSVAVNISDVAAMGGEPTFAFVSIGLPDVDVSVLDGIYQGMYDASAAFGSAIAGGDTVGSGCGIVINVTQLGEVEPDLVAKRSGAKPGDAIIVTNTLGDSRAGLELLLALGMDQAKRISEFCVERHLKPEPRVFEARAAVQTGKVHAMMDLSDGLASDLAKLCESSGVGARVMAESIPTSEDLHIASARLDADSIKLAASGGEDYELLLTCAPGDAESITTAIASTGSAATVIGEITAGTEVSLVLPDGRSEPMPSSWQHFADA